MTSLKKTHTRDTAQRLTFLSECSLCSVPFPPHYFFAGFHAVGPPQMPFSCMALSENCVLKLFLPNPSLLVVLHMFYWTFLLFFLFFDSLRVFVNCLLFPRFFCFCCAFILQALDVARRTHSSMFRCATFLFSTCHVLCLCLVATVPFFVSGLHYIHQCSCF